MRGIYQIFAALKFVLVKWRERIVRSGHWTQQHWEVGAYIGIQELKTLLSLNFWYEINKNSKVLAD